MVAAAVQGAVERGNNETAGEGTGGEGAEFVRSRPTIKDIAAEVGVSHTTVSYILSGNTTQKISTQTRKAVLDAARRLQYVPNSAARSLRKNDTRTISVALEKEVTSTRFSGLLQGIRDGLQSEGYWLMLFDFSASSTLRPSYLESVLQRRTDGIIYISSDGKPPEKEVRQTVLENKLPFVACDCCPEEPELASVSFDYERGAYEVACRLFGEGARRLLYWRPTIQSPQEAYREMGLRRAAELYPGAELSVSLLPSEACEGDRRSVLNGICSQYLAQDVIPRIAQFQPGDAVVCCWSVMLNHLSAALNGKGRGLKLATLSDGEVPVTTECRILASRSNFARGGLECTKLLMGQLRGEKSHSVLIAPDTPSYIET